MIYQGFHLVKGLECRQASSAPSCAFLTFIVCGRAISEEYVVWMVVYVAVKTIYTFQH